MSPLARWRKSLSLRVLASSSLLIFGIVVGASSLLLNQVQNGVVNAKVNDSLVDAVVGHEFARDVVDSFGPNIVTSAAVVDSIVATLARRAGEPAAYEVLLLSNGGGPERSTNAVLPSSVSSELLVKVFADNNQQWTFSSINYVDGTTVPAIAVGAPLLLAEQQQYGLFLMYPTIQQQELLDVVRSAILFISVLLIASLIFVVAVLTRRITDPIRQAADTAQKIASGLLDQRLEVTGEDEVARWAQSFNSMTASLEKQILRLKELSVVQQRFVSDVSHELRTPVTTVRLAADLLHAKRDEFPPDVARAAELLQGELDRFEIMLADLLEISRMDAGAAQLQITTHKAVDILQRVLDSVMPLAKVAGIKINSVVEDSEIKVDCDSRRIERALRNLIMNAIAHSSSTEIEIKISVQGVFCEIAVIDFGIGLTDEQKEQVFLRFWRADPARARDNGGSGLGLSIALEDVKQHDGELEVVDNPSSSGAVFLMRLPISQTVVV
jgi:two-component system, OmpR family, sensor histidine kinase MtrB